MAVPLAHTLYKFTPFHYRDDIIQEYLWIDRLAFIFDGEMKMGSGGTASGASDGDGSASLDGCTFGNKDAREVAITDGVGAVAQGNVVARTLVVADTFNKAIEHGIRRFVIGMEVNTVVHRAFGGERVGAVAERRIDMNLREWIGHADMAVCPLLCVCCC